MSVLIQNETSDYQTRTRNVYPKPLLLFRMIRGCHKKTTGLEGEVGVRSEVANLTALGCKVQATI